MRPRCLFSAEPAVAAKEQREASAFRHGAVPRDIAGFLERTALQQINRLIFFPLAFHAAPTSQALRDFLRHVAAFDAVRCPYHAVLLPRWRRRSRCHSYRLTAARRAGCLSVLIGAFAAAAFFAIDDMVVAPR